MVSMDNETWHGTPNGYTNKKCRCTPCRDAATAYSRARKAVRMPKGQACDLCGSCGVQLLWDHDHQTMAHRGWLCRRCNTGLGLLGDTEASVQRALSYLEAFYG